MKITEFQGYYRFLSNFYLCDVFWEDILYPSSEHAYQASKSIKQKIRISVSHLATPSLAKRFGQGIPLRKDWDKIKIATMKEIVLCKFSQNKLLKEQLLNTGDMILEEGNRWKDEFWGIYKGKGENHLGKILMEVREKLNGYGE